MSDLLIRVEKARRIERRMRELEISLGERPYDFKLKTNLKSMARLLNRARNDLESYATASSIDIVDYRFVQKSDTYSIKSVSDSISSFQTLVTSFYDSIKNKPKASANYGEAVRQESQLNFGYVYPGSLGFVFYIERQRELFRSSLDDAATAIVQSLTIQSSDEANDLSRSLGLAAATSLYEWVSATGTNNLDLDFSWRNANGEVSQKYVSSYEFKKIRAYLSEASEEEVHRINLYGILIGIDLDDLNFHFVVRNGETFKGSLSDGFERRSYEVDRPYNVSIETRTTRMVASGKEKVRYILLKADT